jgi:glycosyltransferase involved in cell wall biosynthesis
MMTASGRNTSTLSIIMPAYNEIQTIGEILVRVVRALPDVPKEIVIVDDCSRDGTGPWLDRNLPGGRLTARSLALDAAGDLVVASGAADTPGAAAAATTTLVVIRHERNQGKGKAVQTGFASCTGDVIVIQDADHEYDPNDWREMYDLIANRQVADVVYGSRFYGTAHRSLYYYHYLANRLISAIYNLMYNQTLTDIEVCYKMFTRQVLQSLRLSARDFGIEVQLSAQIALARRWRIYEVGIHYYGRTYQEGKKINWKDGLKALWYLVKFRFA